MAILTRLKKLPNMEQTMSDKIDYAKIKAIIKSAPY